MMPAKQRADGYMTGMLGLYLTAVELVKLGFIVSPTSRSAKGADLPVTDQRCRKTWAVQVKTNASTAKWWLLSDHSGHLRSPAHVYVFVSVPKTKNAQPRFYVVPSRVVAKTGRKVERSTGSIWYGYQRQDQYENNWKLFGRSR